MIHEHKEELHL